MKIAPARKPRHRASQYLNTRSIYFLEQCIRQFDVSSFFVIVKEAASMVMMKRRLLDVTKVLRLESDMTLQARQ